jgi:hypothetical protein
MSLFGVNDLLAYCFRLFDNDGSGEIAQSELKDLLTVVQSLDTANIRIIQTVDHLLDHLDVNNDGGIDFDEFMKMDRLMPGVLGGAKSLQLRIQDSTFSQEFWHRRKEKLLHEKGAVRWRPTL